MLEEFEDGVFFVSLATLSDPELVIPTIAQALGVKERGGTPLADTLADHLRDRGMLLLLDNFEQLIGHSHFFTTASQLTALLSEAPGVQVMFTSREPLHLYGEHEYPVPPMAMPDPDGATSPNPEDLGQYEAIQLFVARAREARHDFDLTDDNASDVAGICRRLDGLPLALELAAARTRLFSPKALLARLDKRLPLLTGGALDLPARQRTLRGAIAWSYDLLSVDEQRLFTRLAVFSGGCTLDGVVHIWAGEGVQQGEASKPRTIPGAHSSLPATYLEQGEVLDRLESLIGKNLLRQREQEDGEPRFWMLATIREYALEKLAERDELESARWSHAAYYLALAERAEPELRGPQQSEWMQVLDREHDNLRAALDWLTSGRQTTATQPAASSQPPETTDTQIEWAARLASALGRYWPTRGYVAEGRRWFEVVLASVDIEQTDQVRAWHLNAFNHAGTLAGMHGDYDEASVLAKKSLEVARVLNNKQSMGRSLNILGVIARRQGNYPLAEEYFTECLQLFHELGDKVWVAGTLSNLAIVAHIRGKYEEARALIADSIDLRQEIGDKTGLGITLDNLSSMYREHGDFDQARAQIDDALALAQEQGNKLRLTHLLAAKGLLLCDQGDYEQAEPMLNESLEMARATGEQSQLANTLAYLARVALHRRDYPLARSLFRQALDINAQAHKYDVEMVDLLEWIATLEVSQAAASGKPEGYRHAALLLGAAESRREEMGAPIPPVSRTHHSETTRAARDRLGAKLFDATRTEGRDMAFDQALALTLREELVPPSPQTSPDTDTRHQTPDTRLLDLTERELEVLRLLADGLTNKEIAERLVLSYRTVQTHLYRIFNKLDVTTRSAATSHAIRLGLV
jgi:predicted ATPase/DNA-binding CsgD family transcriptional regulator/Flp pilus assembly protein TadD